MRRDRRALISRGGEARIRVRGRPTARLPRLAAPVDRPVGRRLLLGVDAFPPGELIGRQRDIGEDGVAGERSHRIGIGVGIGAWGNAEEAILWIDGPESTVWPNAHP